MMHFNFPAGITERLSLWRSNIYCEFTIKSKNTEDGNKVIENSGNILFKWSILF